MMSTTAAPRTVSRGMKLAGLATAVGLGVTAATVPNMVAQADDDLGIHPPEMPWSHRGALQAFDTAALRRGYQVYREVCSACHSIDQVYFRNFVGVIFTEEQAKTVAASHDFEDGPNDQGAMFKRPGKLFDRLPRPYPNDEFAAFANGGAVPPDLSVMAKARHGDEDYVYALLTGYKSPPAGVKLGALNYNPYFPGGLIAMAPPLQDDQVEYEDGTPATVTQMAKDVTLFLSWCANPEHDARKKAGAKWIVAVAGMAVVTGWYKRFRWGPIKTRRIQYRAGN
jgi:ubiquinol-cytochrome c reductase cytochrome c1 subunit